MFPPVLKTAPTTTPVSKDEAKAHMRVDHDDSDAVIDAMISAAVSYLDGWSGILGRCMINQVWTQGFASFNTGLRLPFPDVSSVTVSYRDEEGSLQTVPGESVELYADNHSSVVRFKKTFSAPALAGDIIMPVTVEMVAGYGDDPASVPQALRHAVLMLAGHFYEHREATTLEGSIGEMPLGVHALIAPFRRGVL